MHLSQPVAAAPPATRTPDTAPTAPVVRHPPWPGSVAHPDTPGFERSAKAWLFDLGPARWQCEGVFHRRPDELARMVRLYIESELATAQTALHRIRLLRTSPDNGELLDFCQRESNWATAMRDQVREVEAALRQRRMARGKAS
ncbi:hypothetical protein [Kitasatospora sp. NPDC085879]|uniref:hypothetical protein n=1 Tax=Kitasatospora sp. NPDC085879 TaxID=3154769 RepID=UPI003427FE49